MKKYILAPLLLTLIFGLSACNLNNSKQLPINENPEQTPQEEPEAEPEPGDSEAPTEVDTEVLEDQSASSMPEQTLEYSQALYTSNEDVLNEEGPKVIFFHADWCPTCRAMTKRITANIDSYPLGTKIVEVDYDTENELKKQYGVKVQSTVVVLNANGEAVSTLVDPSDQKLIEAINQSL